MVYPHNEHDEYGTSAWWLGVVELSMNLDDQISLDHLFLDERKCCVCGETKNLIDGFYKTRKSKSHLSSGLLL